MKTVYVPVYRVAASYTVSFGRRWSVLEHLLLIELSSSKRTLSELATLADLPERLVVEALINLLRVNWIEVRSAGIIAFQATAAGKRWGSEEVLPPQVQRSVKWISLCIDRLTGAWLRADDLDLVYDKDMPSEANKLEPRLHTYSASDGRLRDLLYLDADEVLEPEEPQFRTPSRPFARVTISFDQIDGLSEAPLELQETILSASAHFPDAEKKAQEIESIKAHESLLDTISADDIVVGGTEHRNLLESALLEAKSHFILHSCFLDASVIESLLPEFEKAAKRKVRVDLIWGLNYDPEESKASNAIAQVHSAIGKLSPGAKKLVQLSPISSGSHAKLILFDTADDSWRGFVGSCNFLSSWFNAIDISVGFRNQHIVASILSKLLVAQLPSSGSWSPLARRLCRVWNSVRIGALGRVEEGTHRISLLEDGDHYACVRVARDRAKEKIVVGCDLFGLAAETSILTPMQRAAELGRRVAVFYQRPSKLLKEMGKLPDSNVAADRGIALEICAKLHGKFLLWDDEDAAITSFNWLATVADGTRTRGAEIGVWVSGPNVKALLADKLFKASEGKISL